MKYPLSEMPGTRRVLDWGFWKGGYLCINNKTSWEQAPGLDTNIYTIYTWPKGNFVQYFK